MKGVAFKMVNIDERTEQSEIGGLLVLIIIYFKYFWEMTVEEDKGLLIQ